jgi:hypothetical protein
MKSILLKKKGISYMQDPDVFLKGNPRSFVAAKRLANNQDHANKDACLEYIKTGVGHFVTIQFVEYYGKEFINNLIVTIYGKETKPRKVK